MAGGLLGAIVGGLAGATIGGVLDSDCQCDDPHLEGMIKGGAVGEPDTRRCSSVLNQVRLDLLERLLEEASDAHVYNVAWRS